MALAALLICALLAAHFFMRCWASAVQADDRPMPLWRFVVFTVLTVGLVGAVIA